METTEKPLGYLDKMAALEAALKPRGISVTDEVEQDADYEATEGNIRIDVTKAVHSYLLGETDTQTAADAFSFGVGKDC